MLEPLNIWRYVAKNYSYIRKDYNLIPLITSFFIIPVIITILVTLSLESSGIDKIIINSLTFFSIIIGFLINVLVLILTKKNDFNDTELKKKVETLKEHLGFNIINSIVVGIILVILILFYGEYELFINIKTLNINISQAITLFLSAHFVMLLLNIIRKFGVYVEIITQNKFIKERIVNPK